MFLIVYFSSFCADCSIKSRKVYVKIGDKSSSIGKKQIDLIDKKTHVNCIYLFVSFQMLEEYCIHYIPMMLDIMFLDISSWMNSNMLKLNENKTEFIVSHPKNRERKLRIFELK